MSRLHVFAELLGLPMPLELSFDACSYACFFCFAKLNGRPEKPITPKDFDAVVRVVNRVFGPEYDATDLLHYLLRHRYMICFSNNVDPFGRSNLGYTRAFLELTRTYQLPLWIQTRTNRDTTFLDWLKPDDTFYVSLCTLDEAMAKRVEAGAPAPAHRLACLQEARVRGLRTVLALNPCVPEWITADGGTMSALPAMRAIDRLIDAAVRHGVQGLFVEPLWFRQKQLASLKPPPEQWPLVLRSVGYDQSFPFFSALFDAARAASLPIISSCMALQDRYDPVDWAFTRQFSNNDMVYAHLWQVYQRHHVPLLVPWRTIKQCYQFPAQRFKKHQVLQRFGLLVPHAHEVFSAWPPLVSLADMAHYAFNHVIDELSIWHEAWFSELLDQDGRNMSDGQDNLVAVFDPSRLGEPLYEKDLAADALWVEPEGSQEVLPCHVREEAVSFSATGVPAKAPADV